MSTLRRIALWYLPVTLGIALFAGLVLRTGLASIWHQVLALRFGLLLIIALGGVSHLVKTWAWRLTFTCDIRNLSWPRSFALRLVSDAVGKVGIAGKVFGEGIRLSLVGAAVPIENAISAAALDNALYSLTAALVALSGTAAVVFMAPLSPGMRFYLSLIAGVLVAMVFLGAVAFGRGWRFLAKITRAIGRIPLCKEWVNRKQSVIDSAEHNLLTFHRERSAAFWAALTLNFVSQALAIAEVYLILRLMGAKPSVFGAFVMEGLTKLINLGGAVLNPGNIGTYEAATVFIAKLFGITGGLGLTLALCRRARAAFWTSAGALCLILMKRPSARQNEVLAHDVPALANAVPSVYP